MSNQQNEELLEYLKEQEDDELHEKTERQHIEQIGKQTLVVFENIGQLLSLVQAYLDKR